jgi:hypothetical protein
VSVNEVKTKMVLLSNKRNIEGSYTLRLFGTELKMTNQVKYFEMILDKKLEKRNVVLRCERLEDDNI